MRLPQTIFALLISAPLLTHAQGIKRWVDEEGRVHFGDAPPPAAAFEEMELTPASILGSGGLRPGEKEMLREREARERRFEEAKHRSAKELRRKNADSGRTGFHKSRCAYYRHKLDYHEQRKRRGYSRGEEAAIDDKISWSKMKVAQYCE